MIRIFVHEEIKAILSQSELVALKEDFRHYKETGALPDSFGRDVPYDSDVTLPLLRSEDVCHLHLAEDRPWPVSLVQFSRTSDTHLIYCQGFSNPDFYLLITVLSPDAHNQARNNSVMHNIGLIAERFRSQF